MVLVRLHATIAAVCPIDGISGVQGAIRIDYRPEATAPQRLAAQTTLAAFDWSEAADLAWANTVARTNSIDAVDHDHTAIYKTLRAAAAVLVDEVNMLLGAIPRPIASITRSGTTATITTPTAHGLASNATIAIIGAVPVAYNGVKTITVTGATTLTYTVAGSPTTPATSTILYALSANAPPLARTLADALTAIKAKVNSGVVD